MESCAAFEQWFDAEHAPMVLECPGWAAARRLDVLDWEPDPASHMILHYLHDAGALQSDEAVAARATEQYNLLSAQPWFTPPAVTYCIHPKPID